MRNPASLLIAASLALATPGAFAQESMNKDGMGDSMRKEGEMSHKTKPVSKKKEHMKDSMGHDSMGKDSMSKDTMKEKPAGNKPSAM